MKKLALLFFVFLGLAGVALAQRQDPDVLTLPITTACIKTVDLNANLLRQYGENPMVVGSAMIFAGRLDEYVEGLIKMYVNSETYTFTVVFENPQDGISCVMATGDELKPAQQGRTQL